MNFIGIDPGKSGGIVILNSDGMLQGMCRLSVSEFDVASFLEYHDAGDADMAVIEQVGAMPRQGVSSTFKFGQSYGFLRGILTAIKVPFDEVRPQVWQKSMGCLTKGDKNVTKQKAGQLFPGVKVHHWNADALLIAEYCRRTWNMRNGGQACL